MAYVWFAFISLVWGGSFMLMKKGAVWFSPTAVGAWRVVGGAAILAIVWWRSSSRWSLRRRDLAAMAFVVLFGFVWPFSIQPYLVAHDGSAFIGMMVSFTPLLTIAVSIPLLGIYPARRQLIGVLGALGFMGLLMWDGRNRQIPPVDLALAMTVPLCYACTNTLIRKSLDHVPSLELSFLSLTAAGAILLPLSLMIPAERGSVETSDMAVAVASLVFLGVVGTGISTYVFNRMIYDKGPLFAGMVTNVVPIGALAWGWADGEPVTGMQLGALAGLVSMVTIVQLGTPRTRGEP
jgi:drug/metabolite transporter (DMT)-like permease